MTKKLHKNLLSNELLFSLILVDLLMFPYIRPLGVNFSFFLVCIWIILNFSKKIFTKDLYAFIIFLFLSFSSFLISTIKFQSYIQSNIIGFGILIIGFIYNLYFKNNSFNNLNVLKNILIIYIVFNFILAIIYYFSANQYFLMRSFWTLSGETLKVDSLVISRFTGILSDPNNLATAVIALSVLLTLCFNISIFTSLLLYLMVTFIVICTQSTTGIVLLMLTGIFLVICKFIPMLKSFKSIKIKNIIIVFLMIALFIFFLGQYIDDFLLSDVYQAFKYRSEHNSLDSRIVIWSRLLSSKNIFEYILLGDGGNIIINGLSYGSHNGHFYLIFNYGFIAYLAYLWVYFRPRKIKYKIFPYYIFILIMLVGFTVNIGLQDMRFTIILSIISGFYASVNLKMY